MFQKCGTKGTTAERSVWLRRMFSETGGHATFTTVSVMMAEARHQILLSFLLSKFCIDLPEVRQSRVLRCGER